MTTFKSLLPPNATALERRLEQATAPRAAPRIIPTLWNADTCPLALLPWLANAMSVDDWDPNWPEAKKRAAIREAPQLHRIKGTPAAIRKALEVRGHPDAILVERADCVLHDGSAVRNGYRRRGGPSAWATYRVILKRPVTIAQADAIKAMLDRVKRNCVHLVALEFTQAAFLHDHTLMRDGSATRGMVT